MATTRFSSWYRRLLALAEFAGDRDQKNIAERLGVSAAAVTAWKNGTPPRAETVLAAARAYDADPLELLRIAYLSDEEPQKDDPKDRNGQTPIPRLRDAKVRRSF